MIVIDFTMTEPSLNYVLCPDANGGHRICFYVRLNLFFNTQSQSYCSIVNYIDGFNSANINAGKANKITLLCTSYIIEIGIHYKSAAE